MKELGEKPFRAKQLYQWMHVKLAESLDECTNLPKSLKEKLSEYSTYTSLKTVKMLESGIDASWFDRHLEFLFKHGNHEFFR